MNPVDTVNKSVWTLFECAKDAAAANLMQAKKEGKIKIDDATFTLITSLVNVSIEEAYHKGNSVLSRTVKGVVDTARVATPKKK